MLFYGKKLWEDHINTFHEHKKYFQNQITKPFGMSIVDFNDQIREYCDTLIFLQPPLRKRIKRLYDTQHDSLENISEEDIRTDTFDALPGKFKTHINGQFEIVFDPWMRSNF